ncbi:flagellar hook-associated protein FlgK [Abyssisolibacter fermentans]|uniref:flagellar hook-associated protein FlgK n=1 Tax=Abyssisolibacter fermentans TaxID=1766203 RepID=UPI00083540C4|nr:flagellar hook-associated protein FlgK [Abyssisolibacter fermentans]
MANIIGTLSTAISGLYANNKALETTAHNIANVNNPYYVRQQVIQTTSSYKTLSNSNFQIGTGVDVQEIRQIRNEFLDLKYREHSGALGFYNSRNEVLEQVQGIMNEMSDEGLQKVMDQFWNSWDELSKDPSNLTIRGLIKERAEALIDTVNHYSDHLDDLQVNLNNTIKNKVEEVNDIAHRIAEINEKIKKYESNFVTANDYRDERNRLLDRLSELVDMDCYETESGAVNVRICDRHIVMAGNVNDLKLKTNGSSFFDIYWSDDDTMVDIQNGEIAGVLGSRGNVAKTIIEKSNGTVKQKVDVVIAVDLTTTDMTKVNDIINTYEEDMKKRGLEPVFKFVTFGDAPAKEITTDFQTDITANFTTQPEDAENFNEVVNLVKGMTYSDNSLKELVVISDESIGGDGNVIDLADAQSYISDLKALGISTNVVSKEKYRKLGDTGEVGWEYITDKTGGSFIDIDKSAAGELGVELSELSTSNLSVMMGNVESFDEIIPSIKQKLNTFVNTLARNINYIHKQGFTLDGNPGEDFFVAADSSLPIQAGNIKLNPNLSELNNIVAGDTALELGNGKIAAQINNLRDAYIFGSLNSDDYFRDIISDIGVTASTTKSFLESKTMLRNEVDSKRQAISSVSLDEEMTDMLKFQHSYAANSRVVNAVDEMLDRIVNGLGVVGR